MQQYSIQQKVNFWQVSFADLLTLLLCFFVALAAGNQFKPPKSEPMNSITETGTQIAKNQVVETDEGSKTLWFAPEMFDSNNFELHVSSLNELENALRSESYIIKRVQVATCDASLNASKAENWDFSMRRILGLQRQITDIGIDKKILVGRLLGPACMALDSGNQEKQQVAKIIIEYKKINLES